MDRRVWVEDAADAPDDKRVLFEKGKAYFRVAEGEEPQPTGEEKRVFVEDRSDAPEGHDLTFEAGQAYFTVRQLASQVPEGARSIQNPGEAPAGTTVVQGPKGGWYYLPQELAPPEQATEPASGQQQVDMDPKPWLDALGQAGFEAVGSKPGREGFVHLRFRNALGDLTNVTYRTGGVIDGGRSGYMVKDTGGSDYTNENEVRAWLFAVSERVKAIGAEYGIEAYVGGSPTMAYLNIGESDGPVSPAEFAQFMREAEQAIMDNEFDVAVPEAEVEEAHAAFTEYRNAPPREEGGYDVVESTFRERTGRNADDGRTRLSDWSLALATLDALLSESDEAVGRTFTMLTDDDSSFWGSPAGSFDWNTGEIYLNPDEAYSKAAIEENFATNWSSTGHRLHPIVHEFAHAAHATLVFGNVPPEEGDARADAFAKWMDWEDPFDERTARMVSEYASRNPAEFIAEFYTGRILRPRDRYPPVVTQLYERLGGPEIPNIGVVPEEWEEEDT